MIDYGAPPADDQIEITLFGPGYGEAIAVHLGCGAWLLVDSCIDPEFRAPASGIYLDQIGVDASQVRAIVASHWHDDHVRGISQLATKHPNAEFFLSAVFNSKEAGAFLAAFSGNSSAGLARGAKELFSAIQSREAVTPVLHKSIVLEATLSNRPVMVTALSPMPAAFAQSLAHMSQYLPRKAKPINHIPELRPNRESVVLHVNVGEDAILLGADLEEDQTSGWSAMIADNWSRGRRPATAYKVAHHGSSTGDCRQIWENLLTPDPVACLTPFSLGDLRLPTEADKHRVRTMTPHAYTTSGASRRPAMDSGQLKRLGDICKKLARVDAGFGAVRARKHFGSPSWSTELFGAARIL
ncbi:MAG: MBL fold metallo-hydrolase [Gammaproteobacteria bacterium]|nr:MBL fold metallo-hydrolase [Gammaproteobacteria bacterium]